LFPWQLRQSWPTDSDFFFGLSRSTRCECCSYQVSSISVWRVTCFDHFCVFKFFSILLLFLSFILSFFLSFFCQKFIRHISRRLLNGNQWNFTGMLSTMSRCADYFRNFQNGRCCHGNGQNANKLKNTKMIIAGYSPNRWIDPGRTGNRDETTRYQINKPYFSFQIFFDKSIGLDNSLCLYKSSPTTRWNN
jgi:hypothetical protein